MLSFNSCIGEDIMPVVGKKSSFQTLSARGPSKSLWHEDNLYIDKVRSVYARYSNEAYITKNYGTIFWEYAMTMETVGEKYLIVPIIKDGKVVAEMEAFRVKGSVYFRFSKEDKEGFDFFQTLYNLKPTSIVEVSSSGRSEAKSGITIRVSVCRTIKITYGPIEGSPGDELPIETTKTICKFVDQMVPESECLGDVNPETGECGGGGSGGNGYPYPEPPEEVDPCEKIKTNFKDVKFKEKLAAIDKHEILNYDHEMGYAAGYPPSNTGITNTQYPPMENTIGSHSVSLPDGNQYFGFMHTHNNESNGGTPVKIFSPADLATFLTSCVANADAHGSIGDAFAMVVTSEGNYMLKYTGSSSGFGIGSNTIKFWKLWYEREIKAIQDEDGTINQNKVENLFLRFLKEKVKIDGIELYQIAKTTGQAQKLNLNNDNTVVSIPCP